MDLPQTDDYQRLLAHDVPLMDVRAPVEFEHGAFPMANNLPLMNDAERETVGICYKQQGQQPAIELGHELVSGDVKSRRVDEWAGFVQAHPEGVLYCFRGGMRSKIVQQWIYEQTGVMYPRVTGGYKALRNYLLEELDAADNILAFNVLCGRTGVGKTLVLNQLQQKIDLEGIYHHRGSAFGRRFAPQPSQIDIENQLAIELLKHHQKEHQNLVIEDEAKNIGSRCLPQAFVRVIQQSPLVMLEADIQTRVDNVFTEYIINDLAEHQLVLGATDGFVAWSGKLTGALDRIQKRLGGVRYQNLKGIMQDALQQHQQGEPSHHKTWIQSLLVDYYDPMYDYQLQKKVDRLVFRGDSETVVDYLRQQMVR